ncbi:hypothetical protein [Streptomyces lonarensis]|uniref:Phage head morphogenesis domain-containing protein n=1 Tax=Streptomyces lonarensis TaxID=700599 RepID=A0A7X6CXM0_9ACTN|nr:hypothetical protein [Streptomyces lonarensis]NJQ04283.1 hypothetical protein [Streptomyces lonarensis]
MLAGHEAKATRARLKSAADWVDRDEWQASLAALLLQLGLATSTAAAVALLEQLGFPPEDYNGAATVAWLTAAAEGMAEGIVGATLAEVDEALAEPDPVDEDGQSMAPAAVIAAALATARAVRSSEIAESSVTAMSGFGQTEAARGAVGTEGVTKTWLTRSPNPRASHRRMSGQTVGLDDTFSNGARWPGDSSLRDSERARCKCALEITVE